MTEYKIKQQKLNTCEKMYETNYQNKCSVVKILMTLNGNDNECGRLVENVHFASVKMTV